jgi:UDP-N-acetylmuramyl pentapeptide synthase
VFAIPTIFPSDGSATVAAAAAAAAAAVAAAEAEAAAAMEAAAAAATHLQCNSLVMHSRYLPVDDTYSDRS